VSATVKQVIVIRKDLKMRRGKEIAQGSHASAMWLIQRILGDGSNDLHYMNPVGFLGWTEAEREWMAGNYRKIVVTVDSEAELDKLYHQALHNGLTVYKVVDQGATEFHGVPTVTALAIGPNSADAVDFVTSHLKLY
jgi:peptidyl-tRNA hydrolase, PTH2 family